MINWIAFNKSFIFPQLKSTSENECNFSAEERTLNTDSLFWKLSKLQISIFLQTKNAQTRKDSYCGKSNASKSDSAIFFTNANEAQQFF